MKAPATVVIGILSIGTAFSAEPYPVRPIHMAAPTSLRGR